MKKRIALIGDVSCHGKSSIMSQIPIISAFGDIPSIAFNSCLSCSAPYENKYKMEMSESFDNVLSNWTDNNIVYDGFITGYINNADSIPKVREYIADNKLDNPNTIALIDPSFADNGTKYCSITDEHIENYKELIKISDIMTPNMTEACLLAGVDFNEYRDKYITIEHKPDNKENSNELSKKLIESVFPLLDKLRFKKNQITIITGIELYNAVVTILDVYDGDHQKRQTTCNYASKIENRHGAGDIFNAMFFETSTNGLTLVDSLSASTSFVNNALRYSRDMKFDVREGINFEPILIDNIISIRKKIIEIRKQEIKNKGDKQC